MVRMIRPLLCSLLALAAVALLAQPAGAQSRREMQMMADIRMLQEQTQQVQQQLQAALAQIGDSLKQLATRMDEQNAATRKAFADQKLVVDQLGADLRVVRERMDDTNVRITALSQEVEALRLAIPQYPPPSAMPPVDPGAEPSAAAAPAAPTAAPAAPVAPVAPGISPQRLLDTAFADFSAGQWTLCIEGYSTYLRSFPRNDSADDAQFYIGECYYSDGKFTEAMDAYNRVIVTYPKGDRVPEAYYKRGLAFDRLGQADRARESWETLMKQFPDSDMARLAKQNVDRLNRGKPPGR
jgi:tol-pal system protein YbgF